MEGGRVAFGERERERVSGATDRSMLLRVPAIQLVWPQNYTTHLAAADCKLEQRYKIEREGERPVQKQLSNLIMTRNFGLGSTLDLDSDSDSDLAPDLDLDSVLSQH